jgi:hypothetical protein
MTKEEILDGLIETFDNLYEPKKWWLEIASDQAFKIIIEKGYEELEDFDPILADEFLATGEAFLINDRNGMVDNAADLAAQLF